MNYDQGSSEGGGDSIVLTGSNFTGGTPYIDNVEVPSYVVDSDTQITLTLPAHASGDVDIEVRNGFGASDPLVFKYWQLTDLVWGWCHRAKDNTGYVAVPPPTNTGT